MTAQILLFPRYEDFFFQKCSKNLDIKKLTKIENPSSILREAVRIPLGVANLASKYDVSNCSILREMTF